MAETRVKLHLSASVTVSGTYRHIYIWTIVIHDKINSKILKNESELVYEKIYLWIGLVWYPRSHKSVSFTKNIRGKLYNYLY